MFEYWPMNQRATVQTLQHRISEMQSLQLAERALPTPPELRGLLPGGALQRGTVTSVQGSLQLPLALISALSASGAWCGAIGVPRIGVEAAARLGFALERFILVPEPTRHALSIIGTLSEALTAIVLRLPDPARPGDANRIAARLRDHGTALVVLGSWPGSESSIRVTATKWTGLGAGHGLLNTHELSVVTHDQRGRLQHTVQFDDGRLRPCS